MTFSVSDSKSTLVLVLVESGVSRGKSQEAEQLHTYTYYVCAFEQGRHKMKRELMCNQSKKSRGTNHCSFSANGPILKQSNFFQTWQQIEDPHNSCKQQEVFHIESSVRH
jgi:hypothetical protein